MKKISVINGLRGYAILGVIYFHLIGVFFNQAGWLQIENGSWPLLPFNFLGNGWVGVNLFFILSGFVLYLPYINGNRNINSFNDIKIFYTARANRLLPLYYISLIISIFFIIHQTNIHEWSFWKNMILMFTCTFNFTKETFIPTYNYILWSLGLEILFSIIFPFIILAINKFGNKKTFITILLFSIVIRIIGYLHQEYNVAPHLNIIKDSIFGRLDDFGVGMLLAYLFVKDWKKASLEENAILLFCISILFLTIGFYLSDYISLNIIHLSFEPFINTVFQIAFSILMLSLLYMKKNWLRYLFTNKFLQLSGMMCYSLYLWHGNMRWFFIVDYTPLRIISYLFFLAFLSFLTYRYIEFGNKKLKDILPE